MSDPNIIIDAHLDIAYGTVLSGRDFRTSVYKQRDLEQGGPIEEREGIRTAALPEALLGRVGIVFGTLFVSPFTAGSQFTDDRISYRTPREAYARATAQHDVYQRLADENANVTLITRQRDLADVLDSWRDGALMEAHKLGIVLLMEGADPILEPKQFEEWYERGVRIVGPAWRGTRYSGGTGEPGPLSPLGRELLEVMASLNAVLDLSHTAEAANLEALDRYQGTLIASHSNARKFCDTDRHLTDVMIRRLAERGGVIGIPMYNRFLQSGWRRDSGSRKGEVTLADVTASIDYICQMTGSAQHVGIGSDFDGGFGQLSVPAEMDTITDLNLIGPALKAKGYVPEDIAAILHGNFLRILRQTLPD